MPIKSSGTLSFSEIAAEFGDSQPHSMSEFYRGGGKVPNSAGNSAIATSGAIAFNHFYNAANRITSNITISADTANYTLNTAKVAGYSAGITDVVLTINSGVTVYSNSTGTAAFIVDTSWTSGDTLTIVNNGTILGKGGNGGAGGNGGLGLSGTSGGPGLSVQRATSINNANRISGGGGGGGGGQAASIMVGEDSGYAGGGGGGGGIGNGGGSIAYDGATGGTAGTLTSAGAGGLRGTYGGGGGSTGGGAGGTYGTSGESRSGAGGGSGGAAVSGNSNVTWIATGTRNGGIS